jgi:hypothetical protein
MVISKLRTTKLRILRQPATYTHAALHHEFHYRADRNNVNTNLVHRSKMNFWRKIIALAAYLIITNKYASIELPHSSAAPRPVRRFPAPQARQK